MTMSMFRSWIASSRLHGGAAVAQGFGFDAQPVELATASSLGEPLFGRLSARLHGDLHGQAFGREMNVPRKRLDEVDQVDSRVEVPC